MKLTYPSQRFEELKNNLRTVEAKIAEAAGDTSGARSAGSPLPSLTVVTKFFPAEDVAALYTAGVRNVGENRDQEAGPKAAALLEHTGELDPLTWSFIGQLQTNKAKSVVKYAREVQSVDRPSLAAALSKAYKNQVTRYENNEGPAPAALADGGLRCLIQVGLDETTPATAGQAASGARGGVAPADLLGLAEKITELPGLVLGGVMAVAPLGSDPQRSFERLYYLAQQLQEIYPEANTISAGMSGDLAAAIRWGSTNVRVGSQIMGARPLQ
ncbi:MAG: YggS family pyridoxal phosphate-dependent enzyme [Rothia sp. (in: high G+C Gram-positive bacteria)]|nr:YggS family pyridoxal phosphate-dependent enzyme [Rothia sp. (in: high G+C Gram-positive bacteria)]